MLAYFYVITTTLTTYEPRSKRHSSWTWSSV